MPPQKWPGPLGGGCVDSAPGDRNVDPFRDEPPGPRWRVIGREKDWTLHEKTKDAWAPKWTRDDRGPCESRRTKVRVALEAAGAGDDSAVGKALAAWET